MKPSTRRMSNFVNQGLFLEKGQWKKKLNGTGVPIYQKVECRKNWIKEIYYHLGSNKSRMILKEIKEVLFPDLRFINLPINDVQSI